MIKRILLLILIPFSAHALQNGAYLENEKNTIQVFKHASPFVVYVYRVRRVVSTYDTYYIPAGAGSGFIWDDKGHIVTNYHVIRGAQTVAVSTKKGKAVRAKIIGIEPRKDIAVLKLVSTKYLPKTNGQDRIPLADSNQIEVGQKTIAIGNPYGLSRTLTTGIVSAVGRRVRGVAGVAIYDMIQTDASINPGNSGGPLLNSQGQLLGMNTVIYSRSGSSSGIGFAVPSNTIRRIVNQILKYGRVVKIGIGIHRLDERVAAQLGAAGVVIGDVVKGGPADKAGLRGTFRDNAGQIHIGDTIVAINGKRVRNYDDFYNIMEKVKVGTRIEVKYLRKRKLLKVKLRTTDLEALD